MRLLAFGGWGQLGSDLAAIAEGRFELIRPRRSEADVTDRDQVETAVGTALPDVVLDAAAFHKVERCEEDPATSFAVNAVGAMHVAAAARRHGARCVFVSSDYVFDGATSTGYREDDPVGPINVYGVSKAAGERAVRLACPDSLVVRGSGLFGHAGSSGKGGNFVETMLAKARAGDAISVVDDQIFSPSSTRDMAERIVLLVERSVPPGIYHVTNAGVCSWYRFARTIFELAGVEANLSPRPAVDEGVRRPKNSVLLDTRSEPLGLPRARPWQEALAWYLSADRSPVGAGPA